MPLARWGILSLAIALAVSAPGSALAAAVSPSPAPARATSPRPVVDRGNVPMHFEANLGQASPDVRFLARGSSYALFLTSTEAVLVVAPQGSAPDTQPRSRRRAKGRADERTVPGERSVVRMKLIGANPHAEVVGAEPLPGKVNDFRGRDPSAWRTNIPTYARVRYRDVYPGVDLVYYGNQRQLEYDLVVAPGVNPETIAVALEGAERMEVDVQGHLVLHLKGGALRQLKPVVYQEVAGRRTTVDARYVLGDGRVGFEVAAYDRTRPLVIDPVLVYSTYLGGTDDDEGRGIAIDAAGNAYVTSLTFSLDFPTANPIQAAKGGDYDVFVTKLNPTATALIYATYLGGSGFDGPGGIAVDAAGNAYVTGATDSADFPTAAALQPANGGGFADIFVTKLDPTGSALVYSTYLGGTGDDEGFAVAADSAGNAYVTGLTDSTAFPTTVGAFQTLNAGSYDAFVVTLTPSGTSLGYSTLVGGALDDIATAIAVDSAGNAYLTGLTDSTDFPTASPLQAAYGGGPADVFVAKLNPTGTALVYSTYLGGSDDDEAIGLAVDSAGSAYVTGFTVSADFPTVSPLQAYSGDGFEDVFVAKLNPTGGALVYSTYVGGLDTDVAFAIGVDSAGNAYVTGFTSAMGFPAQTSLNLGGSALANIFVFKLNTAGSALNYAALLGGVRESWGAAIAVDAKGYAYVTGRLVSPDFPTTPGTVQETFPGGGDGTGFVVKLDPLSIVPPGDQSSFEDTIPSLQMQGSGPIGDPLTWSATGLPPGLLINPTTGLISGSLDFFSAGTYPVTVSLSHPGATTTASFTWTVINVNRPPIVTTPGDQTTNEGVVVSLPIVATDPDLETLTYSATGLPLGLAISPTTGLISGTVSFEAATPPSAAYSVTVTVTDGLDSVSVGFIWTVINVNRKPAVTNPGTQTTNEGAPASLQILASDTDGDPLTYSATGLPSGLAINATTGLISGTVAFGAAAPPSTSYAVTVTVSDNQGGSTSVSFTWTVLNVNRRPVVTNPGSQTSSEGAAASLPIVASDPDADPLTYSATGLPSGLAINATTGLISGTVAFGAASPPSTSYAVTVAVSDGQGGTGSTSFTWAVVNVNRPPTVTNPGTQTTSEGAPASLQIMASDADGDPLTYGVTGLPSGLAINATTGLISGTVAFGAAAPPSTAYAVTVTVSDGQGGSASASFTWTVINVNRPPTIANPGSQTSVEGATIALQIVASDPDSDPLTYGATGLPPGLAIDPTTGLISGTVGLPAGLYAITASVSDGQGGSASTSFSWRVRKAGHQPPDCSTAQPSLAQIRPPNHRMVPITVQGVTDPEGDPVTITITAILQDEPTNGRGDGNTPIDGAGVGTAVARVRAERSGKGNGRVYEIRFSATDTQGESCTGSVLVGVPHDRRHPAIDDGVRYDSTVAGPRVR